MKSRTRAPRRLALVLSGGGARGAYEVGVLCYLLPRLAALGIHIDVLVATSVGALNACALAATAHYPGVAGARLRAGLLRRAWNAIETDKIFLPRYTSAVFSLLLHLTNVRGPRLESVLRGSAPLSERLARLKDVGPYGFQALYDTTPLNRTLRDNALIDWPQLHENLEEGHLSALALSATSIASGETVVFTQSHQPIGPRFIPSEHLRLLPVQVDYRHALASAAIPFLFPPIRVPLPSEGRNGLFMDGGIRQNTPLLPAILLNADSILVIGLHASEQLEPSPVVEERFEVVHILGKILNAFFLDRVRTDFDRLVIMNKLIRNAQPGRLEAINEDRTRRGKDPLKEIRAIRLTPTRDIGRVIAELWVRKPELHRPPWRWMFDAQDLHGSAFGDLLSYVFFHPEFARTLISLGEDDAASTLKDAHLRWLGGLEGGEEPE